MLKKWENWLADLCKTRQTHNPLNNNNGAKPTAGTIVSWPKSKQWLFTWQGNKPRMPQICNEAVSDGVFYTLRVPA